MGKALLGVGILALPAVVARIGVGTSLIFVAFIAFLTYLSLHYLTIASARSGLLRYSDVARVYAGLFGSAITDVALIINCGGLLVVQYILLGDLLTASSPDNPGLLSDSCGTRVTVLFVLTLFLIGPLVSVSKLKNVAGVSMLGVTAIMFWAVISFLIFAIALTNGELKALHWWPTGKFVGHGFESAVQMIAIFPLILVAFKCQMTLQHILRDMNNGQDVSNVETISGVALTVASVAFLAIGITGAGLFGKDVDVNVLKNFTVSALQPYVWTEGAQGVFMSVRLAFGIALIASFPIQMIPLREAFWKLFFRQTLQGPGLWVVTYLLLAACFILGSWSVSIWEPLLFIGSTAGVILAFIMPGIFALGIQERLSDTARDRYGRMGGGFVLIVFGVVVGVFGLLRLVLYRSQLG